jgi:hypothetical protein
MTYALDPRLIRPRRIWYTVAVGIAVLGIVIGVGAFAVGIASVTKSLPHLDQTSASGASTVLRLTGGHRYAIYQPEGSSAGCVLAPAAGVEISTSSYDFTFTSKGRQWHLSHQLKVATTGSYTASCGGAPFAVGNRPEVGKFVGGIGAGIAALLGLPCVGLVVGTLIGVVVAIRRRSHRNRLQAAGSPYGPPAY